MSVRTAIQENNNAIIRRMEKAGVRVDRIEVGPVEEYYPRTVYVNPRDVVQAATIALAYERLTGIIVFIRTGS